VKVVPQMGQSKFDISTGRLSSHNVICCWLPQSQRLARSLPDKRPAEINGNEQQKQEKRSNQKVRFPFGKEIFLKK